jgi:hypothetical protein
MEKHDESWEGGVHRLDASFNESTDEGFAPVWF